MKSLLIVDDDNAVLRSFSRALCRDFVVTCCTSVEAALELIASRPTFDVVLCDMHFAEGGASGRDFYERVRGLAPKQADRILILSGEPPDVGDALASRFVVKGTRMEHLLDRVGQVCELRAPSSRAT